MRVGALPLILTAILAIAACGSSTASAPQEPGIPFSGEADPDAVEAFEAVEAAYLAYNSGDVETWTTAREGSDVGFVAELVADYGAALVAAASRIDVSHCVSHGFDDWTSDDGVITGHRFTCEVAERIPFYEAARLDPSAVHEWIVASGQVVQTGSDEKGFANWLSFNTAFRDWMRATHPAEYAGMRFLRLTTDFPSAESMSTALEYVDAFVEESSDWPLSS